MDAFELIEKDHRRFRQLFTEYEEAGDRAYKTKLQIAETLFAELNAHEAMEEEIFYPAVREGASREGVELVLEGYEEHHVADLIVGELQAMEPEDENYDAKFKVLQENIEHHMEEEEEEMFREARKAIDSDERRELGEQMQERRDELLARAEAVRS